LLPLVCKRSRAVRPRAVRLCERLTLLGGPADRRGRRVGGRGREDGGGGGRRGRGAGTVGDTRGLLSPELVARRVCHGYVGLVGRPADRPLAVALPISLLPLVCERGRAVRPRAVRLCERLTLLGGAADRRGRGVGRRRDQYGGGLSRRGRAA